MGPGSTIRVAGFRASLLLAVLAVSLALSPPALAADPSATARTALIGLLNTVPPAPQSSFATLDNTGMPVGTIKIITNPAGAGYIGVYHVNDASGTFYVRVGTSIDLTHWTYAATLASNASQPTIAATSNGGFLVALEKYTPSFLGLTAASSNVEFRFYASYSNLLAAHAAQTFDAGRSLASSFEGTPSIRSVAVGPPSPGLLGLFPGAPMSNSTIQVGFHYLNSSNLDRQATGTLTNFSGWSEQANPALDAAFGSTFKGNVGGRDYLSFEGYPFTVVEAQSTRNDFGSWRVYLYDETAGLLTKLAPVTPGGSLSFGNPKVTLLTDPSGRQALLTSLFVFGIHNGPGEAGPLIYYNEL